MILSAQPADASLELEVAVPTEMARSILAKHWLDLSEHIGAATGHRVQIKALVDPDHCRPEPPRVELVEEAAALEVEAAREAGEIAYYARIMAQVGLPYTAQPGNEFLRVNGYLTVSFVAPAGIGLPYGVIPRLLLCWLTTQAVTTKQRELHLGHTLTEFLDQLQLTRGGGPRGDINRLRRQMTSLFGSTVTAIYTTPGETGIKPIPVAEDVFLWWDPGRPAVPVFWNSTIVLSEPFFRNVVDRPIPIAMEDLQRLRRSPLALDMYVWLSHRLFYLKAPTTVPTELLQAQFGGSERMLQKHFRAQLKRHLAHVKQVWPELNAEITAKGIHLSPSPPVIHRGGVRAPRLR
ncbi:MAG: replication protein RepA [Candidatus Dormibacteria bacterium]